MPSHVNEKWMQDAPIEALLAENRRCTNECHRETAQDFADTAIKFMGFMKTLTQISEHQTGHEKRGGQFTKACRGTNVPDAKE